MSNRHEKEKGVNVQVLLRCRPFSEDELRCNAPQVITCNEYQREVAVSQNVAGKQIDRVFMFDKVFGPNAQQKDLYEQAIAPIVNEVLEGFNCTIFAYGQTGTGKTYTMEGECRRSKSVGGELPNGAGVIPRAVKHIFDILESQGTEYSVKVTFIELYNEEITDLLAPEEISKATLEEKQKKPLLLMEDGKGGVLVRGIEEEIVTNAGEIFSLLERGSSKRRTAETLLNKQSSRSHSLFCITIHIKEATPEGEELIKCGKLNLVDLAGSENISRSGARDGRAREAGEINKSLLTLGRVITSLVEHLGHVPYRDSKLTRLLRDSLGGRTKTCIIATVSPSVYCLEETLSTLDYAHRAKNIKNRPEVNQKMMKSTMIKDLYGEIERLKSEVYAAREKNGVYIPKERYYQEEAEKKAMCERVEQMESILEVNQKHIEDLQGRYDAQAQESADLSAKLDSTERSLDEARVALSETNEALRRTQYIIKETEYVISKQKIAEKSLTEQACLLRSELEKSLQDIAALFSKIERKEKLNAGNKLLVNEFKVDLFGKLKRLSNIVAASLEQQVHYVKSVEEQCTSCLKFHEKSVLDLKQKMEGLKALYASHLEALQNVVFLHKANANSSLEDISSSTCCDFSSTEKMLIAEAAEAKKIFEDLQQSLLSHEGEITMFAQELKERSHHRLELMTEMSTTTSGFYEKLEEESSALQSHLHETHETCSKSILDFQKAFEEQAKFDEQKLVEDISALVSVVMQRKKEMVSTKLMNLKNAISEEKVSTQKHVSVMESVNNDAKRKWAEFFVKAEDDARGIAEFSSAKHCRMEECLQNCMRVTNTASEHSVRTNNSVKEMGTKHVAKVESLVRDAVNANELHTVEVRENCSEANKEVINGGELIIQHLDGFSETIRSRTAEVVSTVSSNSNTLVKFEDEHKSHMLEIEQTSERCLSEDYMDYEPTNSTPEKKDATLPTKEMIDGLRALPCDALREEFRENNPFLPSQVCENGLTSDPKNVGSHNILDMRSPLKEVN